MSDSPKLLESAPIIQPLIHELTATTAQLITQGTDPHLAVVLVGDHPDSLKYIDIKTARAKKVGITVSLYHLEADAPVSELEEVLDYLSGDADVHGIIVQLPLPSQPSADELRHILAHIAPEKDVDGLRGLWQTQSYADASAQAIRQVQPYALPPMVAAVCLLLDYYQLSPAGKNIVIVGRGILVGQPLLAFFQKLHYTVTAVDEETDAILTITQQADILIAGTGSENLVTFQWIKEGAVVLDCARDVHRDSVDQVASAVAPAVGGLGPLTVTWLLYNTVVAAQQAAESEAHGSAT